MIPRAPPSRRNQGWEPFRDREESSIPSLLPEHHFSLRSITESYARASTSNAIHAYIGLTVHWAGLDDVAHGCQSNPTGRWPSR